MPVTFLPLKEEIQDSCKRVLLRRVPSWDSLLREPPTLKKRSSSVRLLNPNKCRLAPVKVPNRMVANHWSFPPGLSIHGCRLQQGSLQGDIRNATEGKEDEQWQPDSKQPVGSWPPVYSATVLQPSDILDVAQNTAKYTGVKSRTKAQKDIRSRMSPLSDSGRKSPSASKGHHVWQPLNSHANLFAPPNRKETSSLCAQGTQMRLPMIKV